MIDILAHRNLKGVLYLSFASYQTDLHAAGFKQMAVKKKIISEPRSPTKLLHQRQFIMDKSSSPAPEKSVSAKAEVSNTETIG